MADEQSHSPSGKADHERPLTVRRAIRWALIISAWYLAGAAIVKIPPAAGSVWILALVVAVVYIHVLRPARRGEHHKLAALRAGPPSGLSAWIVIGLVLVPICTTLVVPAYLPLLPPPSTTRLDRFLNYANEGGLVPVALLTVLLGPMIEEMAFRGWLQGALERMMSPTLAVVVAAALFAALHQAEGVPLIFGLGVLCGWAAWRSGSVWSAVMIHMSYNAIVWAFGSLVEDVPDLGAAAMGGRALGAVVVLVVIVRLGSRAAGRQEVPATS